MVWLIVISVICVVVAYFLFAPFCIEIDSEKQIFRFKFHSWLELRLVESQNSLFIRLKIFGLTKLWDVFSDNKRPQKKEKFRKPKKSKISKERLIALLKSFKLIKFQLTIDTGDMPTNGLLFPVFYLIKERTHLDVSINFKNYNIFILHTENNLARVSKAMIF